MEELEPELGCGEEENKGQEALQGQGHSLKALKMLAAALEVQMGWRSSGRSR